jgi:hypothetical protein
VSIQGYIVWYPNEVKADDKIRKRINGYIYTYNDEIRENRTRLVQSFQAYNEVADLIEKDFPQELNANGQPVYNEKMQCVLNGTMIMIKTYSKSKKRFTLTPTVRIDRIYHVYRNHQELAENLGYDKNDEIQAELDRYTTNVEDEVSFDEQEFDMLERK